uniref:MADF domain-containing protein n=1 Tax=Anabas testudineus TaxID=64144 RepID=A0A7N6BIS4_ANATE
MNSVERKLADLIRQHPHLYDHTQRDYKDPAKGHLSWKEIADAMGKSEDEVKLKWKNLRDKFCKAKKRMAKRNLAWLSAYVKPRVETGSGDDPEKEGDKDKKEQHCSLPVVSTSFSLAESCSTSDQEMKRTSAALKRKRQTASETEINEDEMFLLSLLPSLKRLNIKKRMEVRMKFQQVLYAAEFED